MSRLGQIFLMVSDLSTSRTFYENSIGLEPSEIGDSSVAYQTGSCELKIESDFDPQILEQFNISPPPEEARGTGAIHVIEVDVQLDDLFERIERALADEPGELLIEPREVPWGDRMFLVADPDGYVLEIRSPKA
jgi:catechol 2,3-dioxygenase-like lactoylglutathione lyase family enzyme